MTNFIPVIWSLPFLSFSFGHCQFIIVILSLALLRCSFVLLGADKREDDKMEDSREEEPDLTAALETLPETGTEQDPTLSVRHEVCYKPFN